MNSMNRRTLWTRVTLTAFYFAATFCYLFYLSDGNTFCRGAHGRLVETIRLAIGCTAWSLFASLCGTIALHKFKNSEILCRIYQLCRGAFGIHFRS